MVQLEARDRRQPRRAFVLKRETLRVNAFPDALTGAYFVEQALFGVHERADRDRRVRLLPPDVRVGLAHRVPIDLLGDEVGQAPPIIELMIGVRHEQAGKEPDKGGRALIAPAVGNLAPELWFGSGPAGKLVARQFRRALDECETVRLTVHAHFEPKLRRDPGLGGLVPV